MKFKEVKISFKIPPIILGTKPIKKKKKKNGNNK